MIENTGLQVYDAINEDSKLPNIEYPDTDASKAIIEFHACKYQAIICLMVWSFKSFLSVFGIWNTTNKHPSRSRTELLGDWPVPEAVPSGYPNPTRYPVFFSIPDPTRFSFRNHRVAGNPKHRVLLDISGKPEVSGTTRYFGYHP